MGRKPRIQAAGKPERSSNVTYEKLAHLPFKTAKALKEAQEEVRLAVWRRLEEAKIIHEMLERDEYAFWTKEFREGLACTYSDDSDPNLVRVFSDGHGIRIQINRTLAEAGPASEKVLGTLVQAMSESFAQTYYRAKGILPTPSEVEQAMNAATSRPASE